MFFQLFGKISFSLLVCLHVSSSVFSGSFQSVCGFGKQGCEPGRPNQAGSRATQVLHERNGMINVSQLERKAAMSGRGLNEAVINHISLAAFQFPMCLQSKYNGVPVKVSWGKDFKILFNSLKQLLALHLHTFAMCHFLNCCMFPLFHVCIWLAVDLIQRRCA